MGYIYFNANPQGYHMTDCVIRAISLAMNMPYEEVVYLLSRNSNYYDCECLNKLCYEKLLDYDFKLPHYLGNNKLAKDVADDFTNNIVILRMDGHLSCALYGNIYDIFDCSDYEITDFWVVS